MTKSISEMKGIFTAPITPFDNKNQINENAIKLLFEKNISEDVNGFFVGGSSGECFLLSFEERIHLFQMAMKYKGKKKIIAHIGAISTDEAIKYGLEAKKLGFDAIAATPPFYYKFSHTSVSEYFYDIAKATDMPVIIYNFPGNTGYEFDLNNKDIKSMLQSKAVMGVKHTNLNLYQMERMKSLNCDLLIYNGFDEVLISGLAIGADGAIGSTFNVMYPHYKKLYEAFSDFNLSEARLLQVRANNIMEAFCKVGLIPSIKHILSTQNIDAGIARKPFAYLTESEKSYIEEIWNNNVYRSGQKT